MKNAVLCRVVVRMLLHLLAASSFAQVIPSQSSVASQTSLLLDKRVFVVFLGTGTPRPDPTRQGPSLAIVANGQAYLVDAGTGLVRQAAAAFLQGVTALQPNQLDIAFLTHLHSDHTLGLADLMLTPWVMGRTAPLRLYGPVGTKAMVNALQQAYSEDIELRIHGLEHQTRTGQEVAVQEIQPGVVYQDENVKVTAFAVKHGSWKEALGYRFDADGKSIVVSGDTRPTESVIRSCNGCDLLIHEAYSFEAGQNAYFASFHTSAAELGKIAAQARPKMLVVTHLVVGPRSSAARAVQEIQQNFEGRIAVAKDLEIIAP